ncbi:hypothetical protein FRC15_008149 [Serendipita sp. 397]|nr:hypothetical protein FRC15_008149 [Serendipita sp. 397]
MSNLFSQPLGSQPATTSIFGPRPGATTMFGSALGTSTAPAAPAPAQPSFSWGTSSTTNAGTMAQPSTATPAITAMTGTGFGLGNSTLFQQSRPTSGFLGSSTLGVSSLGTAPQPGAAASTAPSAPSQLPVLNGAAKFNDLPVAVQDLFNDTESLIQKGLNTAKDLKARKLGDSIVANTANSRQLFHDLTSSSNTLQADDLLAKNLRAKVDQAVQDVVVCSQIVEGFRESGIQHPNLKTNAHYPIEFFVRLTDQMQERLIRYKATVDQLNRKLAFSFQAQQTPQAIATTLQSQHAAFIALAAKVAEIEASLEDVKSQFATLYKARTGSALDPFGRTIPAP